MDELIALNIVIADRTYRLKTKAADEESIRKTAKLINEKISEFKVAFGGKDMQDYISMVLLWLAVDQASAKGQLSADAEVAGVLNSMESQLDKALLSS